jgi:DNA-binding NarL/FixJ family response regulator
MKIVIVDDSPIIRARLITMLDDIDSLEIVGQANSGQEAIDVVSRLNPDAMVLDIRMPGLTGVDVLERLKKTNPRMLIIMMTNYPYQQYRERCMAAGADYFFDKSTEFDKIIGVFAEAAQTKI